MFDPQHVQRTTTSFEHTHTSTKISRNAELINQGIGIIVTTSDRSTLRIASRVYSATNAYFSYRTLQSTSLALAPTPCPQVMFIWLAADAGTSGLLLLMLLRSTLN
jgi:hypothetical protein